MKQYIFNHQALQKAMKESKISITQLSKMIGVSRQFLSRILSGDSQPSMDVFLRFFDVLPPYYYGQFIMTYKGN